MSNTRILRAPGAEVAGQSPANPVASAPPAAAGGLKAWLPLIANLLLMPVLAYAMTMFVLLPKMKSGGHAAARASANGEHTGGSSANPGGKEANKVNVPLSNKVLVNLSGTMGTRYLLANITLVGGQPELKEAVEKQDAQLRDVAASVLANKTIADIDKPGARNLISGNLIGCAFNGGGSNFIQGNFFGTDATGALPRGNRSGLVFDGSANNLIGGTDAGAGNLLSGNTGQGVYINGLNANTNVVIGNLIGTDVSGTSALGNGEYGVFIGGGSGNVIGGTTPGAGNVISGSGVQGIAIYTAGNVIQGNFIGTDITGTNAMANVIGIFVSSGAGNRVGGLTPSSRNIVSSHARASWRKAAVNGSALGLASPQGTCWIASTMAYDSGL